MIRWRWARRQDPDKNESWKTLARRSWWNTVLMHPSGAVERGAGGGHLRVIIRMVV